MAAARLQDRREVRRDGGLADTALGIEDRQDRGALGPAVGFDRSTLQDRTRPVVDGLAADAHGLDAPAQRFGGIRAGEILVLDLTRTWIEPREGALRDDHQGRDRPPAVAEQRVVLERLVEVGLAIEDRDGDIAPAGEQSLELVRMGDGRDREAGGAKLGGDRSGFVGWKGDSDGRSGHDLSPPIRGRAQPR